VRPRRWSAVICRGRRTFGRPACCPATNSTASTGTASISRAMRFFSWAGRGRMWPSRCSGTAGGSIWALCTCPTVPSPTRAASRA
ncbi:hypothetical protein, partial [Flavonifractor plautii]|uniref:hypothetical protein n=1 Tax=Flavonifractor plautii TaxID=292800 RepID=UPI003D31CA74